MEMRECFLKGGTFGKIRRRRMATTTAGGMEEEEVKRINYVHYKHTDSCSSSRWNSRESFEYMYGRPWETVSRFYSGLMRSGGRGGCTSLSDALFPSALLKHKPPNIIENMHELEDPKLRVLPREGRAGRWERMTFKIILSYHGGSFDGWQKQPGLNTVQGLVEKALGRFVDDRKAQQLRDNNLPVEGCALVAGRTDKGVTALQQVCSFYTWRKDVTSVDIKDAINDAATGILTALFVAEVPRVFHPNFAAKWRRYFYIFPLDDGDQGKISAGQRDYSVTYDDNDNMMEIQTKHDEDESLLAGNNGGKDLDTGTKPRNFSIRKVNKLLCQLEGKYLSYRMFARDTKASRSTGPATECFMFHARAVETNLPCANQVHSLRVMCVELVANRFLRKMVRVLVATAIREAAAGAEDDALLKLMDATCRRATAPPAPPEGLCLVDVGYGEFDPDNCLIV
ncbi:pseudouridylate synthase [Iris pallida]|uniref:tRNA pseudouridine synthase n=1 Tax=Iris pallida TaxID=29817 RepID=A0AAX6EJ13_IRIPA|nr:pseudouridylate synthase [Iris pallida]